MHEGFWYAVGAGITRPRAHDMRPYNEVRKPKAYRRGGTLGRPSLALCEARGKSKAALTGGFAEGNYTYFRLKKAFMPGYSATSPSLPLCANAHNGDPII